MLLSQLAKNLGLDFKAQDFEIESINTLKEANSKQISFFDNPKYINELSKTHARAVFIQEKYLKNLPKSSIALITDEPYLMMAKASFYFKKELFRENKEPKISKKANVLKSAHIANGAVIEDNVTILSGAVIGENVTIGEGSVIYPNVTIYNDVKIGKNVIIHAGSVIGCDGFGYAHTKSGEHIKIYHNGDVIIEDRVEIGANSTIDRAVFGSTIIRKGTKIDNLVQIGHNCEIGENTILVSQVGVSGSTKMGRNVVMGGQSATAGHLEIGDFVTIAARGGVTKSVKKKDIYSGFPLIRHKEWLKLQAKIAKLLKS